MVEVSLTGQNNPLVVEVVRFAESEIQAGPFLPFGRTKLWFNRHLPKKGILPRGIGEGLNHYYLPLLYIRKWCTHRRNIRSH